MNFRFRNTVQHRAHCSGGFFGKDHDEDCDGRGGGDDHEPCRVRVQGWLFGISGFGNLAPAKGA